jgi:hypothetical protein
VVKQANPKKASPKGNYLFGKVNFYFFLRKLPFSFDYFLASCLSGKDSSLSGYLFFPFGSYKSRLVRDLVVRDLPFWF